MRGEFHGGVCDGHSHPVGQEPLPETLASPCTLGAGVIATGHYILAGIRRAGDGHDPASTTDLAIYEWEPGPGIAPGATSRPAE
jgi:hypothetical protein